MLCYKLFAPFIRASSPLNIFCLLFNVLLVVAAPDKCDVLVLSTLLTEETKENNVKTQGNHRQ